MKRHPGTGMWPTSATASSSNTITTIRLSVRYSYCNPFRRQPWRFLWWLDDQGHKRITNERVWRFLFLRLCVVLDGKMS